MAAPVNDNKVAELSLHDKFSQDIGGDLGELAKLIFPKDIVAYEKNADGSFILKFKKSFTGQVICEGKKASLIFAQTIQGKISSQKKGEVQTHTLELQQVTAVKKITVAICQIQQTVGAAADIAVTGSRFFMSFNVVTASARYFKSALKLNPIVFN